MKYLTKLVELRNELKDIEKKIYHISAEIDNCVGEMINVLEHQGLIQRKSIEKEFKNYYYCKDCDNHWEDVWTCSCNDKCSNCNKEIEPYKYEDV